MSGTWMTYYTRRLVRRQDIPVLIEDLQRVPVRQPVNRFDPDFLQPPVARCKISASDRRRPVMRFFHGFSALCQADLQHIALLQHRVHVSLLAVEQNAVPAVFEAAQLL